jgi:hypothetical protein
MWEIDVLRPNPEIWLLLHDALTCYDACRRLLLRQLTKKFDLLGPELQHEILNLSGENIDRLAEALLDMKTLEELKIWLVKNNRYSKLQLTAQTLE